MGSIAAEERTLSSLRHRNSIPALHLPPQIETASDKPIPTVDFELPSLRQPPHSYISLKDLLPCSPTGVQSPPAAACAAAANQGCCEISIRNRLVKQAAWAYLQPMSSSPDSAGRNFFRRISSTGFLGFFKNRVFPALRRAFNRLLGFFSFAGKRSSR